MGDTILTGTCNFHTGTLWNMDWLPTKPQPKANLATTTPSAKPADLVAFGHAALFSPTIAALTNALRRSFIPNFPGLSLITLKKYPPHSVATAKGHLRQQRQGIQSTKPAQPPPLPLLPEEDDDSQPQSDSPNQCTHLCYAAVMEPTGKIYSDQTGCFIIPSSTGNNYVLVFTTMTATPFMLNQCQTEQLKPT
jgi:hypothetical protein